MRPLAAVDLTLAAIPIPIAALADDLLVELLEHPSRRLPVNHHCR
jgi:hypothetical protein